MSLKRKGPSHFQNVLLLSRVVNLDRKPLPSIHARRRVFAAPGRTRAGQVLEKGKRDEQDSRRVRHVIHPWPSFRDFSFPGNSNRSLKYDVPYK
jgi:hypothetical protein